MKLNLVPGSGPDVPDEVLKELDLVVASFHRHDPINVPALDALKELYLRACNNPHVAVIGHPDQYCKLDLTVVENRFFWQEIFAAMAANKVAFEINLKNPPEKKLVALAVEQTELYFFLSADFHDFSRYGKDGSSRIRHFKDRWRQTSGRLTKDEREKLRAYQDSELRPYPSEVFMRSCFDMIDTLSKCGVTLDRVVNSSLSSLLDWLSNRDSTTTKNIKLVRSIFQERQAERLQVDP